jgi:hypothetical protein
MFRTGMFPQTSGDKEVWGGGHLAFFTYQDLCVMFAEAGFDPAKMEFHVDQKMYSQPPQWILELHQKLGGKLSNQADYRKICTLYGCPSILFSCVK